MTPWFGTLSRKHWKKSIVFKPKLIVLILRSIVSKIGIAVLKLRRDVWGFRLGDFSLRNFFLKRRNGLLRLGNALLRLGIALLRLGNALLRLGKRFTRASKRVSQAWAQDPSINCSLTQPGLTAFNTWATNRPIVTPSGLPASISRRNPL